jgi:hypothetical protein
MDARVAWQILTRVTNLALAKRNENPCVTQMEAMWDVLDWDLGLILGCLTRHARNDCFS